MSGKLDSELIVKQMMACIKTSVMKAQYARLIQADNVNKGRSLTSSAPRTRRTLSPTKRWTVVEIS